MVDEREIRKLLREYFRVGEFEIEADGRVNVTHGMVELLNLHKFSKLPVKFGKVHGSFYCNNNELTSLENCPHEVGGIFDCSGNNLTSLEGGPETVGLNFVCKGNPLASLKGAPSSINRLFYLDYDPKLPLLRTLAAKDGVLFSQESHDKYPYAIRLERVLYEFRGQGKAGVLKCSHALLTLEKEIGVDIRDNIRW